jgi:DNA polymerase
MREVQGQGPYTSELLFVGEGPGKTEEEKGYPFAGITGKVVRGSVRRAGMEPEDVRWNNAIPIRCRIPSVPAQRAALINKWREHLEPDLARMSPEVIVACGAVALERLVGLRNIKTAHGGIYRRDEALVIPCLHPAGVMRGKIQAERLSIERVISRAVRYAQGELSYVPPSPNVIYEPSWAEASEALGDAKVVVVDTEFDPEEERTWLVGVTADGDNVWSFTGRQIALDGELRAGLAKLFMRKDLTKVAHYHYADVKALRWLGIDTRVPWFDTMFVFATLYPDLPYGLSHVARFYLDNITDWKDMDHEDPAYNALDVHVTWRIYHELLEDVTEARMWEVMEEEVFPVLPLLYGLQERGLQVSRPVLRTMQRAAREESDGLREDVKSQVDEIFERRKAPYVKLIQHNTDEIRGIEEGMPRTCPVHPTYTGLRGKRWTTNDNCTCQTTNQSSFVGERRSRISSLRNEMTKAKGKLKRWERGFDPNNNDHLRWLLYDKDGLALPVQKSRTTRRPTADATAVARLLALKGTARKAGAVELLRSIKRLQHLEKELSTFLFMKKGKATREILDKEFKVHPPYRMVAGTGRPASGDDEYIEEKGAGGMKFNALNIPEEVRVIYVPREVKDEQGEVARGTACAVGEST